MIDPMTAASAVSTGLNLLSNLAGTAEEPKGNDVVNRTDFLTLLISQLQNQDPLDPVSSENFSAQLAQFSSLEQLTQINEKLTTLQQPNGAASQFDMLSLLGREVRGFGSTISVADGTASTLQFDLASAGSAEAQIINASGEQVATVDLGTLGAGTHEFDLASLSDTPALLDGSYRVLINQVNGELSLPVQTMVVGRVTGLDFANDPPVLLLGGTRLTLEDVTEIHEAQQG